jgi:HMG box factor
MMYPQPVMALPAAGFYTYDQALPFSPTAGSFSAQMDPQVPHVTLPQDQPVMQAQQHLFAAPYPSPTGGFFSNADGGNGMIRLQPPPVSARWDQTHLLPPSSELGLDGLGFDSDDFLLQDFGAALAQATQYDESVW